MVFFLQFYLSISFFLSFSRIESVDSFRRNSYITVATTAHVQLLAGRVSRIKKIKTDDNILLIDKHNIIM